MTTPSSLLCQVEAGVAWITLNRPDQRNALDIPTLQKLHGLLDDCNADPAVRVLVLTGSGRSFCAGADLAEWAEAEARGALESYGWTETAHALMGRLYGLDKPTIAAINGTAVGAGMDLSLCCDLRIAARSARFKAGYTSMAYSPDAGASWHLPRLIGSEQAKRLLFLDEPWGAERALAAGLVGEVCADEQLSSAAGALAARLASGPTFAFAQTKRLLREGAGRSLPEQLRAELAAGLLCGRSADGAEALRAATEKRAPNFIGR
ncbi:enoyl-CoA hydratase/isomerase family protein [Pseudomonas chlororaphis]|uniref:enoyl-CoA hydratase/isomerase family protein n=1 Tax=Pseudomonas chlororaphis TaxID=587753 RepID=UPI000F57D59E|nr:enoyl-CoA hydratase-related protein [Pseudomonas chlororaphis]AZC50331.1 Enoyl-CoA hydratase [Pseudomonas chlororaphis subsp. piscium]AZC56907.1 Enoyl-CoA hydratase [Pseudomonas chlororaphis subsp. piscium]AZC81823.1 Enoyl-CoA hydratase [Pseudomonas chlororaphis subsp. piscium]MBP5054929.1 enoyl-CoA hydratase/isomerase family protein [Pseudomonas chlororaphis]MBP5087586.1 enoyl-CoA hydratase/isomerase family protein [Pseudomonas chlororaphis]